MRMHVKSDPRADNPAVNFGAMATAICWESVDAISY
jgi:hypothetical protein